MNSNQQCPYCDGTGIITAASYRLRIHFPNDGDWHMLDDDYDTLDDAQWSAIDMQHGDVDVKFEVITPKGERIAV